MNELSNYIKKLLQKGQALVEFAMILPVFLMLCFGTLYGGMMMADYLALKNFANNVSKLAANNYNEVFKENGHLVVDDTKVTKVEALKSNLALMTCEVPSDKDINNVSKTNGIITVKVYAEFKNNFPKIIESLAPKKENGKRVYSVTATSIKEDNSGNGNNGNGNGNGNGDGDGDSGNSNN